MFTSLFACFSSSSVPKLARHVARYGLLGSLLLWCNTAVHAAMGLLELPVQSESGPVTVFYPTTAEPAPTRRGVFELLVAVDAPPAPPAQGSGQRLVVISHGSPASPWVYTELARTLVEAGFVVALPEHQADNYRDDSEPGPPSWKRRPLEVSRAIDRLAVEPQFKDHLDLDKVGVYGMSAGGHTALTLAGGRWSPAALRAHCEQHLSEDFHTCTGPITALTGGLLDPIKLTIARWILNSRLSDTQSYAHTDPRVAAIVAGVPLAADFDPASFQTLSAPLALISARKDQWLHPRFHSDVVLKSCPSCTHLADLPTGGHGALLAPLPPNRGGLIGTLIADPPDFDRAIVVPDINRKITDYFLKHLTPPRP